MLPMALDCPFLIASLINLTVLIQIPRQTPHPPHLHSTGDLAYNIRSLLSFKLVLSVLLESNQLP